MTKTKPTLFMRFRVIVYGFAIGTGLVAISTLRMAHILQWDSLTASTEFFVAMSGPFAFLRMESMNPVGIAFSLSLLLLTFSHALYHNALAKWMSIIAISFWFLYGLAFAYYGI